PWFTDWGRDTFIALRGLCLATGRLDDARDILLAGASAVSKGMLPNRFPDHGEQPEYNAVDASLWYITAVHEYLDASKSVISSSVNSEATPTADDERSTDSLKTDSLIRAVCSSVTARIIKALSGHGLSALS